MDSGKYNRKIKFYINEEVQDADGVIVNTPVMVLETWANKRVPDSLSSARANEGGEMVLNTFVQFKIRNRKDFTAIKEHWIEEAGQSYVIHQINSDIDPAKGVNDVVITAAIQNNG